MKHYNSVSTNACIESQLSYKENCNGTECTLLIPKDINYKRVLPKTNTISIVIILLCVIVGDSARGVLFPTLFSYIKSLGGDRVCQGFAVAAFSVGRILSSPIFGTLSEEYGNRYVLVCCNVIITIGCLLYIISTSYVWVILSQFVIGFGAGSLGVTRSFVAEHTEPENRGVYLAYLTAAQYAGLAVTPILGSIISELAIENSFHIGYLTSNQYTAPSMFIGVAALFICLLLVFLLKDVSREKVDNEVPPQEITVVDENDKPTSMFDLSLREKVSLGGIALNFISKGTIGVFETLGLQFVIHNYQWSGSQLGLVISLCGMVGVAFLLGFKQILTIATDIDWVMYGLIIMTISCLLLMNYGGAVVPLNCYYTSVILMYAIGYPIGHTAVIAMFSRIVKSGPQGTLQGYFAASGSLARVILPLLAGLVTQYYGEHIFFFAIGVCLGITCVIYCTTKKYFEMVVS